jgi:hypothetical protein
MLSSCLADDLNSSLGRSTWSVGEKSALMLEMTSRRYLPAAAACGGGAA